MKPRPQNNYDIASDAGTSYEIIRTNLESGLQEIEHHSARKVSNQICLKCGKPIGERCNICGKCAGKLITSNSRELKQRRIKL